MAKKKAIKKKDSKQQNVVSKVIAGKDLKKAVQKAVDLVGGFLNFIEKGDHVFVKPNFNTNDAYPGSTDPEFLKAVIELLYLHGAKKVTVAESSCFHSDSVKMMEHILPIIKQTKAELIILSEKKDWKRVDVKGKYMTTFNVSETYLNADKIIFLPCMKTHKQAGFTLSLKLPMGMIKGTDRMKMHICKLQKKIADMNLAIPAPLLSIIDARKCFITGGPCKGNVREPDLIMASSERVALDVEAIKVIQEFKGNKLGKKSPWEFGQVKAAIANEIGNVKSEKDYKVIYSDTLLKKRKSFL